MTEVARRDPERWGLDDMPLLVAEARASGDQPLEAEVLRRYGFAVPTDAALDAIVACSPRGVLELGAGTGHWAALLARRGVDVVAYDVAPPPSPANAWFAGVQPWHHVHPGDERVVEECAERSLLLVWPTRNETWASDAVDRYHAAGGHHVVFVGEGPGGRTGDSGFHARLGETAGVHRVHLRCRRHGLHVRDRRALDPNVAHGAAPLARRRNRAARVRAGPR